MHSSNRRDGFAISQTVLNELTEIVGELCASRMADNATINSLLVSVLEVKEKKERRIESEGTLKFINISRGAYIQGMDNRTCLRQIK